MLINNKRDMNKKNKNIKKEDKTNFYEKIDEDTENMVESVVENMEEFEPPESIITIEKREKQIIYIQNNKIYMKDKTINLGSKFRSILFIECNRIKILVKDKTLSVNCVDCEKCHLYIENSIICNLSLLRFNNSVLWINLSSQIPLVYLNICHNLKLHTQIGSVEKYIVVTCMDIKYHSRHNKYLRNSIEEPLPVNLFHPPTSFDLVVDGMKED